MHGATIKLADTYLSKSVITSKFQSFLKAHTQILIAYFWKHKWNF